MKALEELLGGRLTSALWGQGAHTSSFIVAILPGFTQDSSILTLLLPIWRFNFTEWHSSECLRQLNAVPTFLTPTDRASIVSMVEPLWANPEEPSEPPSSLVWSWPQKVLMGFSCDPLPLLELDKVIWITIVLTTVCEVIPCTACLALGKSFDLSPRYLLRELY